MLKSDLFSKTPSHTPIQSSNRILTHSTSPNHRSLTRSTTPVKPFQGQWSRSTRTMLMDNSLNTATSESPLKKGRTKKAAFSDFLEKAVFRPSTSLRVIPAHNQKQRPSFIMGKHLVRVESATSIMRGSVSGNFDGHHHQQPYVHGSDSSIIHGLTYSLPKTPLKPKSILRNKTHTKSEQGVGISSNTSFGKIYDQPASRIDYLSSTSINNTIQSNIIYSQHNGFLAPTRQTPQSLSHSPDKQRHKQVGVKAKSSLSLDRGKANSSEIFSRIQLPRKEKTMLEALRERILGDLNQSQKECQKTEQVGSTNTIPKVGKFSLSTLIDKKLYARVVSRIDNKKAKTATGGTDSHLEKQKQVKNKKLPAKTVQVKSWVEKLPKFTNLLQLPTPKNQMKDLTSELHKNELNPETEKKLAPWNELFIPNNSKGGDEAESQYITPEMRHTIEEKTKICKKIRN